MAHVLCQVYVMTEVFRSCTSCHKL